MIKQQNLDSDSSSGTPEAVLINSMPLGLLKLFPTPLQKQSLTLWEEPIANQDLGFVRDGVHIFSFKKE